MRWMCHGAALVFTSALCADVPCNSSSGPDVIIGDLPDVSFFGRVGDICAYSVATNIVNIGDEPLAWFAQTNQHPVIAQHMYRLDDQGIEQIGLSWVKHGFGALALDDFGCGCKNPGSFDWLGVGCSDPYTTDLNGDQDGIPGWEVAGLGPRWEVDAGNGEFPFPYETFGESGDAIYKRLQVHADDLDPSLNEGAIWFVEGLYVTPDDAQAGNGGNSLGYREVVHTGATGGGWTLAPTGPCVSGESPILAWRDAFSDVYVSEATDWNGTRIVLGSRYRQLEEGVWQYEYALHNINFSRDLGNFNVRHGVDVEFDAVSMHRPDHHSGGPWTNLQWPSEKTGWGIFRFIAPTYASAQHWGTLFNFRFTCNAPPVLGEAWAQAAQAGTPNDYDFTAFVPGDAAGCQGDADGDGTVDVDDVLTVVAAWGTSGPGDLDGDGVVSVADLLLVIKHWGC